MVFSFFFEYYLFLAEHMRSRRACELEQAPPMKPGGASPCGVPDDDGMAAIRRDAVSKGRRKRVAPAPRSCYFSMRSMSFWAAAIANSSSFTCASISMTSAFAGSISSLSVLKSAASSSGP